MLTQDEIERARSLVAGGLDDIGDIKTLKKIADQAVTAIALADENERLKADLTALTDVKRVADNLLEMERINRMGDLAVENARLKAKLDAVCEVCDDALVQAGACEDDWSHGGASVASDILAIIDKDGE